MKIKLNVSESRWAELERMLTAAGFEISDEADLILHERTQGVTFLRARREDETFRIPAEEIVFIESFGKSVVLHTMEGEYALTERLKELEVILDAAQFLRISNSVIIAKGAIRSVRPTLGRKFILTMKNGAQVDVTRSHYERFREAFGI